MIDFFHAYLDVKQNPGMYRQTELPDFCREVRFPYSSDLPCFFSMFEMNSRIWKGNDSKAFYCDIKASQMCAFRGIIFEACAISCAVKDLRTDYSFASRKRLIMQLHDCSVIPFRLFYPKRCSKRLATKSALSLERAVSVDFLCSICYNSDIERYCQLQWSWFRC